ncbi:peptidoglycan DD-metalloendopeptidase family protein [bacterium]|nr:peptidoglycan DD-metalloendopeptidase family protein [bacterium]
MTFRTIMFKSLFLIILLIFSASALPLNLYADTVEDQINNIQKEKEETQKKVENAKKEEEQYIQQVNDVESSLLASLTELEELNGKLKETKSKIADLTLSISIKEKELKTIEGEISNRSEILNKRAAEIYKRGNRNVLDVVFKADDFLDFFTRVKMLTSIVKEDIEIINEIKERKILLIESKKNILKMQNEEVSQKNDLEKFIAEEENKKSEIEVIYKKKKDLLTVATANKEALITMENQLEQKEKEIGKVLESYSYGSAPSGKLLWPVLGQISSSFGNRRSGSGKYRLHAGVDIYAKAGSPIYAAETGQVIKAEYDGGYGYCILIYHGGNFATFYAHLSGFAIATGQYVQKGQLIGYVGTTGYTTGPHLHFEVRIKGAVNNPLNYF